MDEPGCGAVSEVGKAQVEEVDDNQEFRKPEMSPHPEVDETEDEQIRGDVVSANVCGRVDVDCVFAIQAPCID